MLNATRNEDVEAQVHKLLEQLTKNPTKHPTCMPPPGTSATIGPQTIPPGLVAVRELVTRYFWPMAFPSCWSTVVADFCVSRDRPVTFAEFAEHMMWWDDGRFARHPTLKFVFLNVKNKKQALDSSRFFLKKSQDSLPQDSNELLERLGNKDVKLAKDILFFSGTIRGTSQYWHRQHQELNAFVDFSSHQGVPPSYFNTGSCAENHWKPLTTLLHSFMTAVDGKEVADRILAHTPAGRSARRAAILKHDLIVVRYFQLRTQDFFDIVLRKHFELGDWWGRYEFAKGRGAIHYHSMLFSRVFAELMERLSTACAKGIEAIHVEERMTVSTVSAAEREARVSAQIYPVGCCGWCGG